MTVAANNKAGASNSGQPFVLVLLTWNNSLKCWDEAGLRAKLGKAARQQIINQQSLDAMVDKEVALYKEILQAR